MKFFIYFVFLIQFIQRVYSSYKITCILVAAPKKIPMLTYTIDYFLNAYNYNHEGIEIEEFYLVKGTEIPFPEMDECAQKLRDVGIQTNNDTYEYEWKEGTDLHNKFKNFYVRFRAEFGENFWDDMRYTWSNKDNMINYYNYQAIDKIKKKKNGYPDYLLFIEDDMAMKKTWFVELRKMLEIRDPTESSLKISYLLQHPPDENGYYFHKDSCAYGFFGVLLNDVQFRNWDRLSHFLPYGYCGDQFHCMMMWWYDKRIRMNQLWYHFGRDKEIIPRDPSYWD